MARGRLPPLEINWIPFKKYSRTRGGRLTGTARDRRRLVIGLGKPLGIALVELGTSGTRKIAQVR